MDAMNLIIGAALIIIVVICAAILCPKPGKGE